MDKTENKAENRMNENSQTKKSESTDEFYFNLVREKSQESEKSLNCLTKNGLQKIQAQNNWGMRESQMSTKNYLLQLLS